MGTRAKHVKTEFEKNRDKYREASPRHVVIFEADMTEGQKRHTFAISDDLRQAGNELVGEELAKLKQLEQTKKYRGMKKAYGWDCEQMKNLKEDSEEYKKLNEDKEAIGKKMASEQEKYGLKKTAFEDRMAEIAKGYNLNSVFAKNRADDIWDGMDSVLYGNGKELHFKRRGDLPVIQASQINRGIVLSVDGKGELLFFAEQIGEFKIKAFTGDLFLEDEYAAILRYMNNKEMEDEAVNFYAETGVLLPVFRPCYVSLKCEEIRRKLRVYIQITVASDPIPKKKKDGSPRHELGIGRIGIDLGTQSCAVVSAGGVDLFNLSERGGRCTKKSEPRKRFLKREIWNSKKATNPEKFNADGTYKKGSRGKWKKSKRCRKMEAELRDIERRDALSRKYAKNEDINQIRAMGDVCVIEPPNAKKLQKRTKKTERQKKAVVITKKDGTQITVCKYKRKKRFGYSILHRCPGAYQAALKERFGEKYHEVPQNYRASQYDHKQDAYIKKPLSQRWHEFQDGDMVQRDIYSAFLMYCADDDFNKIDREKCIAYFDDFFTMHGLAIDGIIAEGKEICNSGIKIPQKKKN